MKNKENSTKYGYTHKSKHGSFDIKSNGTGGGTGICCNYILRTSDIRGTTTIYINNLHIHYGNDAKIKKYSMLVYYDTTSLK